MSKRKDPETRPSSSVAQASEPKKAKLDKDTKDKSLLADLERLNASLDKINHIGCDAGESSPTNPVDSEKLLHLMQKAKDLGNALVHSNKQNRALLTSQDLAVNIEGETGLHKKILQTNKSLLNALPEVGETTGEEGYLSLAVDAFAEELDAIRQNEEIGPSKLELLIDSLKTGAVFYSQYELDLLQQSINK
jgi:hypothetical protein